MSTFIWPVVLDEDGRYKDLPDDRDCPPMYQLFYETMDRIAREYNYYADMFSDMYFVLVSSVPENESDTLEFLHHV